jgi:hydroxymethylglutaryl-CoA lyase
MIEDLQVVECPRDAMQGWKTFIPTAKKIEYINALLKVGFHTIDFGSFVSAKAIPQMKDTAEVLDGLQMNNTTSKLLAIIANTRGAQDALHFDSISFLGFPFSISPTFQQRNTNSTLEESLLRVDEIQNLCTRYNKKLVVYLSMAFGNPYGDPYNEEIVLQWADEMVKRDVKIISLADTVGMATPDQISVALQELIPKYKEVEFGIHLHANIENREQKIEAAFLAGCKRYDGALLGIGGCPMANDELVGNINTEWLLSFFDERKIPFQINKEALAISTLLAQEIFA